MGKDKNQTKITAIAVKQNLLIWQLSKSFLDMEKKILDSIKGTKDV